MKPAKSSLWLLLLLPAAGFLFLIATWKNETLPDRREPISATNPLDGDFQHDAANLRTSGLPKKTESADDRSESEKDLVPIAIAELDTRIMQISGPMTREKLLVELHLLDHWSSEAEERLTNESNEMTLPNGEKWNRRSYRAEGYDGVKFIHVMIGENHDLKSVVVQSGDRIDGYRWADGAFLKNPPPLTNMKIPRRSTGVKRWIQDFFNLFGDG